MEIKDSLLPTSVTYSGEFLSSDAKIPTLFEINESSSNNVADEGIMSRDGDKGLAPTSWGLLMNLAPVRGSYLEFYCGASPANDMRPLQGQKRELMSCGER